MEETSLSLKTKSSITLSNFPLFFHIVSQLLLSWFNSDGPWKEQIKNWNILPIGNGICWISLPRETDYLTIGGAKETRQKREDFRIYHILIDAGIGYDSETIPKASWRWKIISCHWVKEIDNDSSVNAFSFWYSTEKLIDFSATPAIEAVFVWGNYTKIVENRFMKDWSWTQTVILSSFIKTLFWQKNKSRHTTTFLREDTLLIFEKYSHKQATRLSGWFRRNDARWSKGMNLEFHTV